MGRVVRAVGSAIGSVARGVGEVVSGVAKGVGSVVGGAFKLAGNIAKGVLGSPLLMGIGGGLLGFTIGGPIGAMLGAGGGAMLGSAFGQAFNGQPDMTGQMGMGMMPQMGMPMAGMMGGMPGMGMGMMPGMGMGMMPGMGMGYPSPMGMMPGMGYPGMDQMMQQQMMMMMMMMMMMQQQQMMMGGGGFPQGMMPMTGGMRDFMGVPGGIPSMGYPGFPNYGGGQISPSMGANAPYNAATGNRLADVAGSWAGRNFKPGQTKRCADWVSTMIEQSGAAPPGFKHQVSCNELQKYGTQVGKDNLKPGDVVFFGNTYQPGKYTHTGIYLGNGKFAHRPTANKPVRIDNLNSGYYAQHFTGGRRLN